MRIYVRSKVSPVVQSSSPVQRLQTPHAHTHTHTCVSTHMIKINEPQLPCLRTTIIIYHTDLDVSHPKCRTHFCQYQLCWGDREWHITCHAHATLMSGLKDVKFVITHTCTCTNMITLQNLHFNFSFIQCICMYCHL